MLARDKLRHYLSLAQAERLVTALRRDGILCVDPRNAPPIHRQTRRTTTCWLSRMSNPRMRFVTGDSHLLGLSVPALRIVTPREFLPLLPS